LDGELAGGVHVTFCAVLEVAVVGDGAEVLVLTSDFRSAKCSPRSRRDVQEHTFNCTTSFVFASRSFCSGFTAGVSDVVS
jgi:hypothetical protein